MQALAYPELVVKESPISIWVNWGSNEVRLLQEAELRKIVKSPNVSDDTKKILHLWLEEIERIEDFAKFTSLGDASSWKRWREQIRFLTDRSRPEAIQEQALALVHILPFIVHDRPSRYTVRCLGGE